MNIQLRENVINALNAYGIDQFEYLRIYIFNKTGKEIELKGEFDMGFLADVRKQVFNELEINYIQDKHNNILKYY